jgi:hypothetical protein
MGRNICIQMLHTFIQYILTEFIFKCNIYIDLLQEKRIYFP